MGKKSKGKKQNITTLKIEAGVSVTSTKGILEAFKKHYEKLGKVSVDKDDWREVVKRKVEVCQVSLRMKF